MDTERAQKKGRGGRGGEKKKKLLILDLDLNEDLSFFLSFLPPCLFGVSEFLFCQTKKFFLETHPCDLCVAHYYKWFVSP